MDAAKGEDVKGLDRRVAILVGDQCLDQRIGGRFGQDAGKSGLAAPESAQ